MCILFFSIQVYDSESFQVSNYWYGFELYFQQVYLQVDMVVFVQGFEVVCVFVNDDFLWLVLECLVVGGMCLVVLCLVGYNYVDLVVVEVFGLLVVYVLVYLLYVVVEYVVGLILMFNWCLYCVYNWICEGDFLLYGLIGFDFYGKCVGVIGIGQIGEIFVCIMVGFGCELLVYDFYFNLCI